MHASRRYEGATSPFAHYELLRKPVHSMAALTMGAAKAVKVCSHARAGGARRGPGDGTQLGTPVHPQPAARAPAGVAPPRLPPLLRHSRQPARAQGGLAGRVAGTRRGWTCGSLWLPSSDTAPSRRACRLRCLSADPRARALPTAGRVHRHAQQQRDARLQGAFPGHLVCRCHICCRAPAPVLRQPLTRPPPISRPRRSCTPAWPSPPA
jgi:hypothetical protein